MWNTEHLKVPSASRTFLSDLLQTTHKFAAILVQEWPNYVYKEPNERQEDIGEGCV